jgi:hypothetical protein
LAAEKFCLILVPDYAGLRKNFLKYEELNLSLAHSYYVTNLDLFDLYSKIFHFKPSGILHDIPNIELIQEIKSQQPKKKSKDGRVRILWIGNSRWGIRQGFADHKGFSTVVIPLKELILKNNSCCDFEIIDFSKRILNQKRFLQRFITLIFCYKFQHLKEQVYQY